MKYSDVIFMTATDSRGQGHRLHGPRLLPFCVAIHPRKEDSVFRHTASEFCRTRHLAESEARYWGRMGYPCEVLEARQVPETEYNGTHPRPIKFDPAFGPGGNRVEEPVD